MVDTIFPTPNTYTGRQGRQTQAPAFAGATAARPLGSMTGVRPGTPSNTVTATTTTVTVQPFAGVADVQTLASAGPYEFAFDAVYTVPLVAQSASVPRSDVVYVQINDNQEDGTGAANSSSATRVYLAGTTVAIPTLPNTRTFIVAVINVPITGSSPTVTWVAPYAVAAGGVLPIDTLANLNAITGSPGQTAYVFADATLTNNAEYVWATTWKKIASPPIVGTIGYSSGWSASATTGGASLRNVGGVTELQIAFSKSSAWVANEQMATLPVGFRPGQNLRFSALATGTASGLAMIDLSPAGALFINGITGTATVQVFASLSYVTEG